jgi:hypothetical protein
MGGFEEVLAAKAFAVMTIEVDGTWGGVLRGWNLTAVDQLAWLARRHGYHTYLKVPCLARLGAGSLEAGRWVADRRRGRWRVGKATEGTHAAWLSPLALVGAPYAPSGYHAASQTGRAVVQDLLLLDAAAPELRELPNRTARDCLVA